MSMSNIEEQIKETLEIMNHSNSYNTTDYVWARQALKENDRKWLQYLLQENERYKELTDWGARIIDSGMYGGSLRYDPLKWFSEYHALKKEGESDENPNTYHA